MVINQPLDLRGNYLGHHVAAQRAAHLRPKRQARRGAGPAFACQHDVNLVKSGCMGKMLRSLRPPFWILIAAEMNAMKKRVNPFGRRVFYRLVEFPVGAWNIDQLHGF